MSGKRALIVDDSKSARTFLARILEQHQLLVDTAGSAEQAIDYLNHSQPDVIFMDHLMPGMDGLQAVQLIKNNPRTAMIPIMMYTSQEGELYLGQARALGAVGVLPKQIRPVDVSKILHQLKLVPDRRGEAQTSFSPANAPALEALKHAAVGPSALAGESKIVSPLAATAELRQMVDVVVRDQLAEFRRTFEAALDAHSLRLLGDVRAAVRELQASPPPADPQRKVGTGQAAWWLAAAATLAACAMTYLWLQESLQNARLAHPQGQVGATASPVQRSAAPEPGVAASREGSKPAPPSTAATSDELRTIVQRVPYGAVPLSGERLESLRMLLNQLASRRFAGRVEVTSYAGRYCLMGDATEGYSLATDDTPLGKCAAIGNPFDEALSPAQREPLLLANLAGALRRESGGAIQMTLLVGAADHTAMAYPAPDAQLPASEWNRIAALNNRLEIRVRASR